MRGWGKGLAVFVGLSLAILIAEIAFGFLNRYQAREEVFSGSYATVWFWESDPILGYRPKANARAESQKSSYGREVYHVFYSTDEYGRRIGAI